MSDSQSAPDGEYESRTGGPGQGESAPGRRKTGKKKPEPPPDGLTVAVIGAGMAGLTAAYRLAERGFHVTVFEKSEHIGGQFGAHTHDPETIEEPTSGKRVPNPNRRYHEHCYHMLLNWYRNFWQLVDDIGLSRENDFEPRAAGRHMTRGDSRMPALVNPGSARYAWDNLLSGLAPPPDMFLYGYSLIDLTTHRMDPDSLLGKYTVNGFLQSRPYASERSAELHQHTLTKIFGAPSYLTSASSYKNLVKFGLRHPEPMMWILKTNSEEGFHRHLYAALKSLEETGTGKCEIRRQCEVTRLLVEPKDPKDPRTRKPSSYRISGIEYNKVSRGHGPYPHCTVGLPVCSDDNLPGTTKFQPPPTAAQKPEPFDYVIVAVSPSAIPKIGIALDKRVTALRAELPPIPRIKLGMPRVPDLKFQQMASLDLYFNRRLAGIPREHVVLLESAYGLTFVDNSQVGDGHPDTVLNVIATDSGALSNLESAEAICAILNELAKYIPFDPQRDLDQKKPPHFQTNVGAELFVNEVGSEQWRPEAQTAVPNLFLAGDYCRTFVDVVSIEAAVVSGLEAARALQARVMSEYHFPEPASETGEVDPRTEPITILEPDAYDESEMAVLKLLFAPYAYAAKYWSALQEAAAPPRITMSPPGMFGAGGDSSAAPDLVTAATRLMVAPVVMAADLWTSACAVWGDLYRQCTGSR